MARLSLEGLPDRNYLKPVVWAEHSEKTGCCGVSLGVRSHVRPLYLYNKLSQLRAIDYCNSGVKLRDVCALKGVNREDMSKKTKYKKSNDEEKLEHEIIPPCHSCKIFFESNTDPSPPNGAPFGNCAEYDIIRTANLNYVLQFIEWQNHWKEYKSACYRHIEAFNDLTQKVKESRQNRSAENKSIMKNYFERTLNAKVLRYQWSNSCGNELIAKDWPWFFKYH